MNLHMLFTNTPSVLANMSQLLQVGDTIILLDEASSLASEVIPMYPQRVIYTRTNEGTDTAISYINDQQWVNLCDQAKLIHSWY